MKSKFLRVSLCGLLCLGILAASVCAFAPETTETADEPAEVVSSAQLSEAVYAEKPAESTADGKLIFFDNGNVNDLVNLSNIALRGVVEPISQTDGFVTRTINTGDTPFQGETFGPCVVASDGESFKDANGKALHGKLTFYVEIYNSAASNKRFYTTVKPQPVGPLNTNDNNVWDAWAKTYTNWGGVNAIAGSWSTLKFTYDTSANALCFGRNAWDPNNAFVRSAYVYYDEYTVAAKPAETTSDGKLVYFNNGNPDDTFNPFGMTLGGVQSALAETDGYLTRGIHADSVFGKNTFGAYVYTKDEALFTDENGKELDGTLTFVMEVYNSADADKGYFASCKPNPGGWDAWCGVYTNWASAKATAKAWSSVKYTYDAKTSLVGLARTAKDASGTNIRAVYVYYAPKPIYAEKPAESTENGKLVFFDNGNPDDKIDLAGMTVNGMRNSFDVTDFTYTRSINTGDTIFAGDTFGVYITPTNGVYQTADGITLDGTLTVCVELYNSASAVSEYYQLQNPAKDEKATAWCNVYTNWVKVQAAPGVWSTLTNTAKTNATVFGLATTTWRPNNTNVRAVYVYYKPNTEVKLQTADVNSIRTSGAAGIRFAAFLNAQAVNAADECGFIVARGDILSAKGLSAAEEVKIAAGSVSEKEIGFSAKTANGLILAGARNYAKGSVNKLAESANGSTPFGDYGEQGSYFTGVVINLDKGYTHADGTAYAHRYNTPLAARSYVKIGSNYFYGECRVKSLSEVAEAIRQNGGDTYTANKDYIDTILAEADAKA